MDPIERLRAEIGSWEFLSKGYKEKAEKLIDGVELQLYDDLVSSHTAADMLQITERQVHNLAADPNINLWKYNSDGTKKTDNRPTKTRYRVSEILNHKGA